MGPIWVAILDLASRGLHPDHLAMAGCAFGASTALWHPAGRAVCLAPGRTGQRPEYGPQNGSKMGYFDP